jgi:hypothetical protein
MRLPVQNYAIPKRLVYFSPGSGVDSHFFALLSAMKSVVCCRYSIAHPP